MIFMMLFFFGGFRIIFALFGVAIALVINFFPLILIGFISYKLFKTIAKKSNIHSHIKNNSFEHKRYSELLVHLIVHVIRADNKVDPRELQAVATFFKSRLGFGMGKMMWIQDLLQHAINQPEHLQSVCIEFNRQFQYDAKRLAIELLYQIAAADGSIDTEEYLVIEKIVRELEISATDHEQIKAMYASAKSDNSSYHEILGVQKVPAKQKSKRLTAMHARPITQTKWHTWANPTKKQPKKKCKKSTKPTIKSIHLPLN